MRTKPIKLSFTSSLLKSTQVPNPIPLLLGLLRSIKFSSCYLVHIFMETKEEARTSPPPTAPQQINFSSSSTSSRKSRRSIQKSVVSMPVFKVDAARPKSGIDAVIMPSDSWTWRKYGQKPIKGSPYPRGYYRCSSSKGCPARKQVERSCVNPTMFTVTYSVNHNHSLPLPKLHHHNSPPAAIAPAEPDSKLPETDEPPPPDLSPTADPEKKFSDLMIEEQALMMTDEFGWFVDINSPCSMSPQAASDADLLYGNILDSAATMHLPDAEDKFSSRGSRVAVDEEEDGLFGGLGELPEWSLVFGHGFLDHQVICGGEVGKRPCGPC